MNVEQLAEWELAGKTEVVREILPECYFVHHKLHMTQLRMKPRLPQWEADD
jgi:hypothetical protein